MQGSHTPPTDVGQFYLSPTRLRTFSRECERLWAFKAFFGRGDGAPTKALLFGTELHGVAEAYQKEGTPPPATKAGTLFSAGLSLLPGPMSPGVYAEEPVALPPIEHPAAPGGFILPGTADLIEITTHKGHRCGVLYDYKTTTDPKWVKTEAELQRDEQVLIYGLATMLKFELTWLRCMWLYFVKEGPQTNTAIPVEFTLTLEATRKWWDTVAVPEIRRALDLYLTPPDVPFTLDPKGYNHCNAYGGCPYRPECDAWDRNQRKANNVDIWAHLKQNPPAAEKAGKAQSVNPSEPPSDPVPTEEAPPPDSTPKRGRGRPKKNPPAAQALTKAVASGDQGDVKAIVRALLVGALEGLDRIE